MGTMVDLKPFTGELPNVKQYVKVTIVATENT